jgi:uncharacterized membrane protein YbhN (UPF0104 family)
MSFDGAAWPKQLRRARSPGDARSSKRWPLRALRRHPSWPWIKRAAVVAFLCVVATLVISEARKVDWAAVLAAFRRMPWPVLMGAGALAVTSHALYSAFDLFGRRYTRHTLPKRTVMALTFVSYAFNLNLGTLIGAAGIRYRLYLQLGLSLDAITRIMTLSMLTNWMGYIVLAGVLFIWQPIPLPYGWAQAPQMQVVLGALVLCLPAAYLAACAFSKQRAVQIRGHRIRLPSIRMALLQLAASCVNWMVIAAVIFTLLQFRIPYPAVLMALLTAAVAGVLLHVPAGLGVLEAVFVLLLSSFISKEELLAALLTYRGMYYLLPLAVAIVAYFALEAGFKRRRDRTDAAETPPDGACRAGRET